MNVYPQGFEEDHRLRSLFVRELLLREIDSTSGSRDSGESMAMEIPKTLIRYWHDENNIPDDVNDCLRSWDRLSTEGVESQMFNDASAAAYIAQRYGTREVTAFSRCRHPAMRCDYFRMCALVFEGGLYVDADDVLLGEDWKYIFHDGALKLQPLCYDIPASGMVPARELWQKDARIDGRVFYVNNDPIAAPPGHPVLLRALASATQKLLGDDGRPEIQATTGPGNLTAALAAHARDLISANAPFDFELLKNWDAIAETRWQLSYRGDARNWRNMDQDDMAFSDGNAE